MLRLGINDTCSYTRYATPIKYGLSQVIYIFVTEFMFVLSDCEEINMVDLHIKIKQKHTDLVLRNLVLQHFSFLLLLT